MFHDALRVARLNAFKARSRRLQVIAAAQRAEAEQVAHASVPLSAQPAPECGCPACQLRRFLSSPSPIRGQADAALAGYLGPDDEAPPDATPKAH